MDVYWMLSTGLILLILLGRIDGACHQTSSTTVDCSRAGLSRVPDNIPTNTKSLDITINNITILNDNDFHHLVNLEYLDLSLNPISTIESMSFYGLSALYRLEIVGHQLNYSVQSLPLDVFKPLGSLNMLSLRSKMQRFHSLQPTISGRVFRNLPNLTELNIDTTHSMIFDDGFSNLTKLHRLIVGTINILGEQFDCSITEISNLTFVKLSSLPITFVDISQCNVIKLDKMFLKSFTMLQTIVLNGFHLALGNFSDVIDILAVFKDKNMSEITFQHFPSNTQYAGSRHVLPVKTLSQICVSKLDLTHDNIMMVDMDALLTPPVPLITKCIKHVFMGENCISGRVSKILYFFTQYLENLETIDLSFQKIFEFNHFESRNSELKTQRFSFVFPILVPPKLKYVNIAGMPYRFGEMTQDVHFFNGDNMEYLNISYCGLSDFSHKISGLQNLKALDLSGNDLSVLNEKIFDTFPNVTHLRLCHAFLDNNFITQHGKRLLTPLRHLEILDLSNNDLVFLPYDIFQSLSTLQVISLTNNRLITMPYLGSLVMLQHIHLSFNALTTINAQYREMLDRTTKNNKRFNLSIFGNTFSCSCSSANFLLWLQETNVRLDGRNYSCMDMNGKMTTTESVTQQFAYFHRTCTSNIWLNWATGGISLMLVVIIVVFVIIKNKMKVMLILLRMIGQDIYPRCREDFEFAACLIDTPCSYPFVSRFVYNELEKKCGLKLNISNRDRNPAHSECRTIVEAMRDSWKIILILSDEFLESNLSSYIMYNCLSAITLSTPDRVIILVNKGTRIPATIGFLLEAVSEGNILDIDMQEPVCQEFWNNLSCKIQDNHGKH